MAQTLTSVSSAVGTTVSATRSSWTGTASDGFQTWWGDIDEGVVGAAAMFGEVATNLDQIADEIERVNDEVHNLYLAIAATAVVSIAAAFITFGASAAVGAALAVRNAATAASLVRTLGTFLSGMRITFTAFKGARFGAFWGKWAIAAGTNTAVTGTFKFVVNGQNPFDGDSWSVRDLTNITVGSTLGAGTTVMVPGAAARPFATGFGAGAAGSVVSDLWVNGMPLNADTFRNAIINGTLSGGGGALTNRIIGRWGGPPARTTGPMDYDPPELFLPGRPMPGDPGDLIVAGCPTPGDPTSIVVPGRPVPGDPGDLIVAGRPTPGDPTSIVVPGRPVPGDPGDLIVAGRSTPVPLEHPVRIYLPHEPGPRPIIAAPPATPLQAIPEGDPQKVTVKIPIELISWIGKDGFIVKPVLIDPAGPVYEPDFGPWPPPPPPVLVPVGAGSPH